MQDREANNRKTRLKTLVDASTKAPLPLHTQQWQDREASTPKSNGNLLMELFNKEKCMQQMCPSTADKSASRKA